MQNQRRFQLRASKIAVVFALFPRTGNTGMRFGETCEIKGVFSRKNPNWQVSATYFPKPAILVRDSGRLAKLKVFATERFGT